MPAIPAAVYDRNEPFSGGTSGGGGPAGMRLPVQPQLADQAVALMAGSGAEPDGIATAGGRRTDLQAPQPFAGDRLVAAVAAHPERPVEADRADGPVDAR